MTSVTYEVTDAKYGYISATFDGTHVARYWKDSYLKDSLLKAIQEAGEGKDAYDLANFIFATLNQFVRRRYSGQEFMLKEVEVFNSDLVTVTISR